MKLTGKIISGQARGREMGFPTLNLLTEGAPQGVYAVRIQLNNESYDGVMHCGPRPTFEEEAQTVELHLFDFEDWLTEGDVEVDVVEELRKVQKFDSKEQLIAQIRTDIEKAKTILL